MRFGIFGEIFNIEEFLFGFFLGLLVIWLLPKLKPILKVAFKWVREQITVAQENLTASTADPYIQDLIFRLDNNHLANPLFALRQILVAPRLLAPQPAVDPSVDDQQVDRYHTILPPLPDWNTLSGIYRTPSISIAELLNSRSNFLITGEIGTGKTTALASLMVRLTSRRLVAGVAGRLQRLVRLQTGSADVQCLQLTSYPRPQAICVNRHQRAGVVQSCPFASLANAGSIFSKHFASSSARSLRASIWW